MYISDKCVFIELEKTGSSHVLLMLQKLESGGVIVGKHNRISEDLLSSDRMILGSIRNPWDWYVSQWGYGCEGGGGLMLRQTGFGLKGYGMRDHPWFALRSILHQPFKPVEKWKYLYEDIRDPERFRMWLKLMFDPKRRHDIGNGYGHSRLSSFAGYLTYSYLYLYSKNISELYSSELQSWADVERIESEQNIVNFFIMNESLEENIIQALTQMGVEVSKEKQHELYTSPRTRESARERDLSYYYDQSSIDMVAQREKFVVNKFSYEKPVLGG